MKLIPCPACQRMMKPMPGKEKCHNCRKKEDRKSYRLKKKLERLAQEPTNTHYTPKKLTKEETRDHIASFIKMHILPIAGMCGTCRILQGNEFLSVAAQYEARDKTRTEERKTKSKMIPFGRNA